MGNVGSNDQKAIQSRIRQTKRRQVVRLGEADPPASRLPRTSLTPRNVTGPSPLYQLSSTNTDSRGNNQHGSLEQFDNPVAGKHATPNSNGTRSASNWQQNYNPPPPPPAADGFASAVSKLDAGSRKSLYDFSHEEQVYEKISDYRVSKEKRRMSMNPNRYEGLDRPTRASFTPSQVSSERNRGDSWSEAPSVRTKKKPPQKKDNAGNRGSPISDEDHEQFIDYTVVPLLVRSNMEYIAANRFAEILKRQYTPSQVQKMLTSPFALLEVLKKENIKYQESFRMNLIGDDYWNSVDQNGGAQKRVSYVYYRENEDPEAEAKMRNRRASKKVSAPNHRTSVKSEFGQVFNEDENAPEIELDEKTLRNSLRLLAQFSSGNKF